LIHPSGPPSPPRQTSHNILDLISKSEFERSESLFNPGNAGLMNERGAEVLRLAKDFGKWYGLNP